MSQSPLEATPRSAEGFLDARAKFEKMFQRGMSWSGNERNCCFLNTGRGRFTDISAVSGLDFSDDGRAAATVDWDHDGDLDLWLVNRTGPQVRFMRNDLPRGGHFVLLKLIGNGQTCSRDAIGARVHVILKNQREEKLVKTLRAGTGYLSQSSKWIHFGLGNEKQIDRVVVEWPDRSGVEKENFANVAADGRYVVVQDTGEARIQKVEVRSLALKPSNLSRPAIATTVRTLLPDPLLMPALQYRGWKHDEPIGIEPDRRPLLINLWASWCRPCLSELAELTTRRGELDEARLGVLALSVDGMGNDKQTSSTDARQRLDSLRFPHASGMATDQLLDKLNIISRAVFVYQRPLPLPSSLLLDTDGRLAAVYKGPVSVDRLLEDVRGLDADRSERLKRALPFAGRRYSQPGRLSLTLVARRLAEAGYVEDAARYLSAHEADVRAGRYAANPRLHKAHYDLAVALAKQGKLATAESQYREALRIEPDFPDAQFNLAALLAEQGKTTEAISAYGQALRIDPQYVKAHVNLALLLSADGQMDLAEKHYLKALRHAPRHVDALNNYGNLLVAWKKPADAVVQFNKALAVDGDDARTHYNLGTALDAMQKFAEAENHYAQAVQLDDQYMLAHNNLGVTLARQGRLDQAEIHVRRAIELDGDYTPARNNLRLIQSLRAKRKQGGR